MRWQLAAIVAAITLSAARADADPSLGTGLRLRIDWGGLAEVMRDGGVSLVSRAFGGFEGVPGTTDLESSALDQSLLVGAAHVSLLARDWGGSQLVFGRLLLTDQSRVTRSSRMVVTRVRLAGGRLATVVQPFAQVGLGQWRIDTDLMPSAPRDVEPAAQIGGGLELALGRFATVAIESDYTILYREQHEPQMVYGPYVLSGLVAARARF